MVMVMVKCSALVRSHLQAGLAINRLHLRDVALVTATASRDARCLYVISIGSTRSLYINMDQLTSTSPLPVTTQTTTLETTLRPEKRPSEASAARPIAAKGAASKCAKQGDGRAVMLVHEHKPHGSAVAKSSKTPHTAGKVHGAQLKVAARRPQPSQP